MGRRDQLGGISPALSQVDLRAGPPAGLPHADAEDVTQEVFKRGAETIHEFESNPARGSFRGWLMQLTLWRITDKFRSQLQESG
ncbi:MAG: hypothetical protein EXS43_14120 [Opitutus sp.]|nr:hypothetical protein [Opitutus sp.]